MKSLEMACGIPTNKFVILLIEWEPILKCQHLRKWQVRYIIHQACFRVVSSHKRSGCVSACSRDVSRRLTYKSLTSYQLKNLFPEKHLKTPLSTPKYNPPPLSQMLVDLGHTFWHLSHSFIYFQQHSVQLTCPSASMTLHSGFPPTSLAHFLPASEINHCPLPLLHPHPPPDNLTHSRGFKYHL